MEKSIIITLFGMAWGSFLNVVIYRIPRNMSLLHPPSTCPGCGKRIKITNNIPVFSYLILRGKCRQCGFKIPVTYLLVEILTPLCFLLIASQYGLSFHFFATCIFTMALIALGFIDFYHQILPDVITLPVFFLALVYSAFRPDLSLRDGLLGAVSGAGFLLIVYGAYFVLRKKEGLGMGDVTMMLMVGAYVGWRQAIFVLILASFVGALVGIFLIFIKRKDMQYALPFGTFIAPAAFVTIIWGERILTWYFGLFKR